MQTFGRSRGLEISPAISRWSQAISRRSRGLEISRGSQAISSSRDRLKHNSRTEGIHFSEDEHSLHTDRKLHYWKFGSWWIIIILKFSTCRVLTIHTSVIVTNRTHISYCFEPSSVVIICFMFTVKLKFPSIVFGTKQFITCLSLFVSLSGTLYTLADQLDFVTTLYSVLEFEN